MASIPAKMSSATDIGNEISSMSQIAVAPQVLDFGKVETDQAKDLSFTITNKGKNTATGHIAMEPSHWIFSHNSFSLAPGKSMTVTLRFSPPFRGTYLANARVNSNAGTQNIILSGTARDSAESQFVTNS
jgi:hypothetical protein